MRVDKQTTRAVNRNRLEHTLVNGLGACLHLFVALLVIAWNVVALLLEALTHDEQETIGLGHHIVIGGDTNGDEVSPVKRAGHHTVSDRTVALYERTQRQ